jgi:acyl-homoserine lactone acylase PvdQ
MTRCGSAILALAALGVLAAAVNACSSSKQAASSSPTTTPVPAASQSVFLDVLPPGSDGNSGDGTASGGPPHASDQLALYGDLSYAQPSLAASPCAPPARASEHQASSQLACNYFKDASLVPQTVASTETLHAKSGGTVTIERDGWGVPFVTAATRADAMYGFGYAAAEDRLWGLDIVRNLGRGQLSEFLGPADGVYSYDSSIAAVGGYNDAELTQMISDAQTKLGSIGTMVAQELEAEIDGINDYVDSLSGSNAGRVPKEYASVKGGVLPAHFTTADLIASEVLVESLFASGGGEEHENELLLQELDPTFGPSSTTVSSSACLLWRDLRHANDPETPRTIDASFSQSPASLDETCPHSLLPGAAVWDPGSFATVTTYAVASPATASSIAVPLSRYGAPLSETSEPGLRFFRAPADPRKGARRALARLGFGLPEGTSNFIAVNASQTSDGHPIAVMGPQTGYFVPQLLWEVALKSTGGTPLDFAGRGVSFLLPYIEIGHGASFAWSATSGESDIIDVRVSKMCNLDGSAPSRNDANGDGFPDADGYLFDAMDGNGPQCRKFYERTDTWTASPTLASLGEGGPSQPQTIRRYILRTHYGPVFATATVSGQPVAISQQRSTFHSEFYTVAPFALAATGAVHDAASFQQLFNGVSGTFNWIYVDAKDVGYVHSGLFPLRSSGHDPDLPVWGDGRFEWTSDTSLPAGYFTQYGGAVPYPGRVTPVLEGSPQRDAQAFSIGWQDFLPFAQHPQAKNPPKGFMASWNNAPASGWWAPDGQGRWGPTHRADMLAERLAAFQATGKKFDIANMVEIMADTGFTDLRGARVLPLLLQIMQMGTLDATQTQVVTMMQDWIDSGSGAWINGQPGLGAWRRDRNDDGVYDQRAQVVLMDAWYPHLVDGLLPQVTAIDGGDSANTNPTSCSGLALQCRLDAPRAQGSAFEYGYFEMMKRVLEMALDTPGHASYRALACAGTGALGDCRNAVLTALDQALADLGGIGASATWDGTTLVNAQTGMTGETVEAYDEITHTAFGLLMVPSIRWINRPTFQQVVEVR